MNLLTIQQECGRLLSDPNNDRWSAATLLTRINIAQQEIQGLTSAVKSAHDYSTSAGSNSISLSSTVMDVLQVTKTLSDGSIKLVQGINREELFFRYPDWNQWTAGEPLLWFFIGASNQLQIIPPIGASFAGSNNISTLESRTPADLVNPTDIPFDSNTQMVPYHYSIVHWVVAHCFMDDGTQEALAKSKFHKSGSMLRPGEYEKETGRIMAEFDVATAVPSHILWQPQGGRVGTNNYPTKSNPLVG